MSAQAETYDVVVVGAGAAGAMAAIRASQAGASVAVVERNDDIGNKILLTGRGRCNVTNAAPIGHFPEKFGPRGEFYRTAFQAFSNDDLIEFFRSAGLEMKAERQGRVFPVTDKAKSVVDVLKSSLARSGAKTVFGRRVTAVKKSGGRFAVMLDSGDHLSAGRVILAAGGASYMSTGSTGDSYAIAKSLGHDIVPLKAALVPLVTKEKWVKSLQGLALENIRLTFVCGKKKIVSPVGELMFTHFGVSGPLVLDLSGEIVSMSEKYGEIPMFIDLKPGLKGEQIESKLLHKFKTKGETKIKNILKDVLPGRLVDLFVDLLGLNPEKKTNQITQKERRAITGLLKALPLNITGSLPIEEAMVTSGGVSIKDIDPRTMASKVVKGLYFAGELIELAAPSGGYNLQQAFSTGYLAGESAAKVEGRE
jgi:predicted Rossmann fold flavoprotein